MRRSDLSRRHFLTTSSLIPFSGLIYSEEVNSRPQATSQLVEPSQKVTVTPTEASVLPNADTIIPVTIIIEITGGFSVFGNEISAGEASINLELGDFSLEEYDTNSGFSVSGESPVRISNDEAVVAPSQHAVTLFLKAGDNPRIELVDSNHDDVDHNTPVEYDTGGEVNWDFFADIADQRSNLYNKYGEAYEGAIDGKAWEEQFAEETINILSTIAVDIAKSKATATVADLLDEDWIKVLGAGYGLRNGIEGTAMGKAITSTFDLKYDFFDHTHKQSIECAGRSDDVLEDLQQLAIDERQAWEEKNRDSIVDALEDQRELLFDTSTGSESLRLESRAQRYYPNNLGRACDGIPFQVGPSDTADEVRDFFEMLMQYARDEEQNLRDTLRFIDPPNASVSTVQHHSEIDADLRQLATGDLDELSVEFEVTNGSSAGLTSEEGYLSISHSEILTTTLDESASDDVIDVIEHDIGDDIINSDGSEVPADYPLLDINGHYEPGETKTLVVDFELDGDPIDEDEDDDAFEDVWFKYRSALQPFLIAEDPNTEAGQNEFARAPADKREDDQQGFSSYEVSAGDSQYPPTAKINAPTRAEEGGSVTFDGSDSTAGGDIDSFSWEFDTDGDGSVDETRSGESVNVIFEEPGAATVRLTVTDDLGTENVTETEVTIEELTPLVASFDRRPSVPEPGDKVEFTSTTDADSYDWEINGQSYSGESVSAMFDDPGEYEVSLEVSRNGESDEITSTFTVEDIEERLGRPRARIEIIGELEVNEEIEFDGTNSYHPDDDKTITDYVWTIDDESFEGEIVTRSFETGGSYSVELTVVTEIDDRQSVNSMSMTLTVGEPTSDPEPPGDDPDLRTTVYLGSNHGLYAVDAETGEKEWIYTDGWREFRSSPTVVNGTVYFGADDGIHLNQGYLYAVDAATGDQKWVFTEPSARVRSSPTVVDGTVYFGTSNDTLYAVDAATGDQEWAFTELPHSVRSSPTVVDGTVYFGTDADALYAVDAATGDQEWVFTEPSARVRSSPTVVDGTVYFGADDGNLYAVDAETGEKQWISTTPASIHSSPLVMDGIVYIGLVDEVPHAVDAKTGDKVWSFTEDPDNLIPAPTPSYGTRTSPTIVDGTVYIGNNDGSLLAINAETGEEEWAFRELSSAVTSSPTVLDGTIFIGSWENEPRDTGTQNETLHAIDAVTHEQKWKFTELNTQIWSSPTVVEQPKDGSSIGSRILQGTLGHTDVFAEQGPTEPKNPADDAGSIIGYLTTPGGSRIQERDIEIKIFDVGTGELKSTTTTGSGGEYSTELIPEQVYEVVVEPVQIGGATTKRFETELEVESGRNEFNVTLEPIPLSPIVGENPPQDINGDGLFEDINGDGSVDVTDVQALHQNINSDTVQQNPELFNFAGGNSDEVTEADVEALYDRVTGGDSDE